MKKANAMILAGLIVISALMLPMLAYQNLSISAPLKCASLTGCGDWSECPDRGRELEPCILDCVNGPIVFCPQHPQK